MFAGLAPPPECQPTSPTEEASVDEVQSGWDDLAAKIRRKAAEARPGQPLDRRVAAAALDLWEADDEAYLLVPTFLVSKGAKGVRRLHRASGCGAATALPPDVPVGARSGHCRQTSPSGYRSGQCRQTSPSGHGRGTAARRPHRGTGGALPPDVPV